MIAFNFTSNQIQLILAIANSCYRGSDLAENEDVWSSFDLLSRGLTYSSTSHSGVMGSLVKKGIVEVHPWDQNNVVRFTEIGLKVAIHWKEIDDTAKEIRNAA